MTTFLEKKGVYPSLQTYVIDALSFMTLGLFSSLIIGLIMSTVGELAQQHIHPAFSFLQSVGDTAMSFMGPAIGAAVAYGLKALRLVLFSALITGAMGAELGGPVGSLLASLVSTEIGKLVSQETKVDIIVTPFTTILVGFAVAKFVGPPMNSMITTFGGFIKWATVQQPFVMGILVAVFMGLALTAPISSAALAIMLGLDGLAAGAATVGCAAQIMGFAASSFRENGWGGFIAQGIGTSMLQVSNIIKNPWILLPPTFASAILGPISIIFFHMENNPAGAGMGTSGLVGQLMTIETMGSRFEVLFAILLFAYCCTNCHKFVILRVVKETWKN